MGHNHQQRVRPASWIISTIRTVCAVSLERTRDHRHIDSIHDGTTRDMTEDALSSQDPPPPTGSRKEQETPTAITHHFPGQRKVNRSTIPSPLRSQAPRL